MKANIEAYHELCAIADSTQWPKHYKNDLYVVDREVLTTSRYGEPPQVFAWVLRDRGTHLFDPRYDAPGGFTATQIQKHFSGFSYKESECRFYWSEYGHVTETTLAEMCERFRTWQYYFAVCRREHRV